MAAERLRKCALLTTAQLAAFGKGVGMPGSA